MNIIISSLNANEAVTYISEFINVANKSPIQNYSGLMSFDSSIYLNKVASQIGHITQLHFRAMPEPGILEVRSVPIIGAVSHLSANILDVTQYSGILAENAVDTPALKELSKIYTAQMTCGRVRSNPESIPDEPVCSYKSGVARMGGPFFDTLLRLNCEKPL